MKFHLPGGADALVRPRGEAALTSAERRARVNGGMCSPRRLTIGGADALVRPRDNAALTYAARSQLEDVVDERTPRIGHGEVVGAIRLAVDVDVVLKHVGGLLRAERRRRLRRKCADELLHFLRFVFRQLRRIDFSVRADVRESAGALDFDAHRRASYYLALGKRAFLRGWTISAGAGAGAGSAGAVKRSEEHTS